MKGGLIEHISDYNALQTYVISKELKDVVSMDASAYAYKKRQKIIGIQALSLFILLSIYNHRIRKTKTQRSLEPWQFQKYNTDDKLSNLQAILFNQILIIKILIKTSHSR